MHFRYCLKFIILSIVFSIVVYLPYKIYSGITTKNKIIRNREILPDFCFNTLDDTLFNLKNIKKGNSSIIVFFDPDCYHCTYEIESIIKNIDSLENTNILMVSNQPVIKLKHFYNQYNLDNYPQIKLLYAGYQDFISVFGDANVPTTFIYDESNKLLRLFKGEVGIEAIIRVINHH